MNSSQKIVERVKLAITYEMYTRSPSGKSFSYQEIIRMFPDISERFISEALPRYTSKDEILRVFPPTGHPESWSLTNGDWMALFDEVSKPHHRFSEYATKGSVWILGDIEPGSVD